MNLNRLSNGKYFVVESYTPSEVNGKIYYFFGDFFYNVNLDINDKLMLKRFQRSSDDPEFKVIKGIFPNYDKMVEAFKKEYIYRGCCLLEIL